MPSFLLYSFSNLSLACDFIMIPVCMICSVRHLDYQDQTRTQGMDRMDLQLDILVLTGMLVLKIRPCNQNKLEFRRVE